GVSQTRSLELIGEEPLLIRIEDNPYSVVMRTPGEEIFQAAGFCLGEGIARSPDDFKTIGYDEALDPNVIDIWLKPERRDKIRQPDQLWHLWQRIDQGFTTDINSH
ncbi:formate dehydrogenase accessory sulfurtransferase FdhD, partial [candidate division CSSED10-310 bacterium]